MKTMVAVGVALALTWLADPASAHVVEVATSVSVAGIEDTAQLDRAIRSAVDDVVTEMLAFRPTVVVVMSGRVMGDRLYLRLLILDQEGEEALSEAEPGQASSQ